jgi:membrane protease YdiL (CAAX protease family)
MSEGQEPVPVPIPVPVPVPEVPPAPTVPAPARSKRSIAIETGAILLALVFPSMVLSFADLLHREGLEPIEEHSISCESLLLDAARETGLIALILYVIGRSGEPWSAFGLSRPRFADIARGLGVLAVVWLEGGSWLPDRGDLLPASNYLALVPAMMVGAFYEELLFRGYLIPRLERLLGSPWWSLLATSALFGTIHAYQGIFAIPDKFFWGIILGAFFLWLRRVWPLAIAHAAMNVLFFTDPTWWKG